MGERNADERERQASRLPPIRTAWTPISGRAEIGATRDRVKPRDCEPSPHPIPTPRLAVIRWRPRSERPEEIRQERGRRSAAADRDAPPPLHNAARSRQECGSFAPALRVATALARHWECTCAATANFAMTTFRDDDMERRDASIRRGVQANAATS